MIESERDILANASAHQQWLLRHDSDLIAQTRQTRSLHINPIHRDRPFCGIEQAHEQTCKRGLAATVGSNNRYELAVVNRERHIVHRIALSTFVAKTHSLKRDVFRMTRQPRQIALTHAFAWNRHEFRKSLCWRRGCLNVVEQSCERPQTCTSDTERSERHDEAVKRHAPLHDLMRGQQRKTHDGGDSHHFNDRR